ncbi:Oidioi.mRNA.OKI2018_I69.PAR.g13108.t1.cds [Oikopleura dioica]|uniref:Oidioi.mRNA.OKI2018_I69.PAR.g13108.t1.cds n=1 Tax=Oikopleura dioica TaxID=34765 RepID=A0ABN7S6N7_OIKDI|nr:Oidioi.mRNA.OKI2018_I69.PAR.g13108.t1.cds [Oikopleura dioica]
MRLTYNLRRYHKIRKTPRPGLSKILADIEEDPASDKARSSQLNLRRRKSNISKSSAEAEIRRGSKKSMKNQKLDVRNLEHRSDFLTARGSTDAIDGSLLDQDPEHAEKKADSIFSSEEEVENEENVEEGGNLKEEAIHVNCICKQLHEDNLSLNKRLDELMLMMMEMKSGRQTAFGTNADSRANDRPINLDVLPDVSESRISAADTEM